MVRKLGTGDYRMASKRALGFAAIATVLVMASCTGAGSDACQCPKPVAYDDATLKKISQALRALPADNVLHQAMEDYENERDDLRFCRP
jgi:hypothetical protein